VEDPDNCVSEKLFKDIADRMVADGWRDAGYTYV
jgi:alpha-N-acetylgalactosaminidase